MRCDKALSKYWSELVRGLEPYVPGEQPRDKKYIKLNTNENPYGPSPKVLEAIKSASDDTLRLYPDPTCEMLLDAAADYYQVGKECIFAGNGSDEVLAFSFMSFFNPDKPILLNDITYSFYPVYAALFNIKYKFVELDDDFSIPVEKLYHSEGGLIIANPNAPTGRYLTIEEVRSIMENNPLNVVIIDEAYIEFGGKSVVPLTMEYPNLLVIQTMSKSHALAGMRIGFAIGNSDLIEAMNRVKNSFNSYTLDRLAIIAGTEALKDEDYYRQTWEKIISTRERVCSKLAEAGFEIVASQANFIFISHPKAAAKDIFSELRDKGILVRYFNKPRIDNCLRVSIGTDVEMDAFIEAVIDIIQVKL